MNYRHKRLIRAHAGTNAASSRSAGDTNGEDHAVAASTLEQMTDIVESLGMSLSPERVAEYMATWAAVSRPTISSMPCPTTFPAVKYPRTPGYFPSAEENPSMPGT